MKHYNALLNKTPIGAVDVGEPVYMEFSLPVDINAKGVFLILSDEEKEICTYAFSLKETKGEENVYSLTFSVQKSGKFFYRFEALTDEGYYFYGADEHLNAIRGDWLPLFKLNVCEGSFSSKTPKGGIIYQIFVDRFCKSKRAYIAFNRQGRLKKWNEEVDIQDEFGNYDAKDFFGGNLFGITDRIDYLKSLNVTQIYLSPIFTSSSNHRYDTGDYLSVDEFLGGEEAFDELLSECKKNGIGVILDGVFNHSGDDSIYFNKYGNYYSLGAYQSTYSPYYNWYTFFEYPDKYACWWGMTCVPTFNKDSSSFTKFLLDEVLDKWTKKGIDGWRLDVVDELPIDFLTKIREKVRSVNPSCYLIGEVWEDASDKVSYSRWRPYFAEKQLDGVMNYVYANAIIDYIRGGKSYDFFTKVANLINNYPLKALNSSMTLLSSHDTVRIVNRLSERNVDGTTKRDRLNIRLTDEEYDFSKKRLYVASVLQFTLPGTPCVYYGDEIGMQGYEDPINRRPFAWDDMDVELLEHYKMLSGIRSRYGKFFAGGVTLTETEEGTIFFRGDKKEIMVFVTSGKENATYVFDEGEEYFSLTNGKEYLCGDEISLKPLSFDILVKSELA